MVFPIVAISCVVFFWRLILCLSETGESEKTPKKNIGEGENSTLNFFSNNLMLYAGIMTLILAVLTFGQVYMMRLVYQLKQDFFSSQTRHREDLDLTFLSKSYSS